eukprot:29457-Pelagococcus_subviridis.AAC.6
MPRAILRDVRVDHRRALRRRRRRLVHRRRRRVARHVGVGGGGMTRDDARVLRPVRRLLHLVKRIRPLAVDVRRLILRGGAVLRDRRFDRVVGVLHRGRDLFRREGRRRLRLRRERFRFRRGRRVDLRAVLYERMSGWS